jgi:hypothetical protein
MFKASASLCFMSSEERCFFWGIRYYSRTIVEPMSVAFFYPRLIPIHDVNPDENGVPRAIRCSFDKISEEGAYILGNSCNTDLATEILH